MFRPGISAHGEASNAQLTVYLAARAPERSAPESTTPVLQGGDPQPAPLPLRSAAPAEAHAQPSAEPGPEPVTPKAAPEESRYYLSSEVDAKARPIHVAPLVYPEQAYYARIAGRVKLRVHLGATGAIDAVDVVEAEPPGVFETAALKAVLDSRFLPAMKDGRNVPSEKLLEIVFDPYENVSKAVP